ncbi:MAG: hypothetical protein DHS20C14_16080 [Phycisphaeraceae bacterium]|nr:MAG: hypothetical protein DHS20C14_16080 [Phycisphaeraceae bacterium]
MTRPTIIALAAGLSLAAGLAPPAPAAASGFALEQDAAAPERSADLRAFMDDYLDALHKRNPEWVGLSIGSDEYNHMLSDSSAQAQLAWTKRVLSWYMTLKQMDRAGFTEDDHLDADLMLYQFSTAIEASGLKRWQMPVNSMGGPQVWLPQMGGRVPLTTGEHYDDWVARLRQVPTAIGDAIDNMRLGIEEGRVPPKAAVEPAVDQAMAQASEGYLSNPEASPFYTPMRALDESDARTAEAARIIAEEITPAYAELAMFLQNEYLPACRETFGISDSVDGVRAYEIALREHTTLELTADDVHNTGLSEVARIRAEMMETIQRTDWASDGPGSRTRFASEDALFAAFVDYLRTDERFYYDDPNDLLVGYRDIAKRMDAEMPKLFGMMTRLPYGVKEIPLFAAKSAPTAYYYSGSVSGGVPGNFMANTYALDQRPKYDMVALTLHEGVPGHHHQIALAQELEGVHPVRKLGGYTAFSEGWGLYSERLGLEVGEDLVDDGVYRGLYADPYDDFGRLNFEMWRALRLVVDSGIHAKGWSRQRAIDYMLANGAITELNARSEVDRYIGWPGQATAYKIGQLKISELRARAEEALGDSFDVRAFHDALLGAGALPLPVLEARMDRWLANEQAQANAG